MVDFVILVLQLLYFKEYLREQHGQGRTCFCFLMNGKFFKPEKRVSSSQSHRHGEDGHDHAVVAEKLK